VLVKRNIALVGFMGTGKSTVGRALAARLARTFLDTDAMIEQRMGMTIPEIFQCRGERAFREAEVQCIYEACRSDNAVIAVGGGAVQNGLVRDALSKNCTVVLLTADISTILKRTSGLTGRPLLDGLQPDEKEARVMQLLKSRAPLYSQVCDVQIDTCRPVRDVVRLIIERIAGESFPQAAADHGRTI